MKLKERLSKLRTKIEALASKDKLEEGDLSQLNADLSEIERSADRIQSDLTAANNESAERRVTINDLEKKVKDKDTEIAELSKRPDPKELEQTIQTQKDKISTLMKGQRTNFENRFKSVSKHQKFEATKKFFKLPEADKDGNYDLSKMSEEDLEHNINKMAEYDEAEMFGKIDQPGAEGGTKKDGPDNNGGEKKIESEDEFNDAIDSEIDKY